MPDPGNRRMIRLLLLVLCMMLIATSWLSDARAEKGKTLVFAADPWCPFNCEKKEKAEGFIVDIARSIFGQAGFSVEYKVMPWTRAIVETKTGSLDGIFSAPKSDETEGLLFPQEPVGVMRNALFKKRGASWHYTGPASLSRITIGIVQSYVFPGEIGTYLAARSAEHDPNLKPIAGPEAGPNNILRFALGHVDAIAEDVSVVAYERAKQHIAEDFEIETMIGEPVPVYIAFSRRNGDAEKLAAILDEGVRRLRASGELAAILAKYGVEDWQK